MKYLQFVLNQWFLAILYRMCIGDITYDRNFVDGKWSDTRLYYRNLKYQGSPLLAQLGPKYPNDRMACVERASQNFESNMHQKGIKCG